MRNLILFCHVRDLENRFIHDTPALYHKRRVSGLRRAETLVIRRWIIFIQRVQFFFIYFLTFLLLRKSLYLTIKMLTYQQNFRYIKYEPFASVFPVFSFEFLDPLKLCGEVAPFYKKFQIEIIFIPLSLLVTSC